MSLLCFIETTGTQQMKKSSKRGRRAAKRAGPRTEKPSSNTRLIRQGLTAGEVADLHVKRPRKQTPVISLVNDPIKHFWWLKKREARITKTAEGTSGIDKNRRVQPMSHNLLSNVCERRALRRSSILATGKGGKQNHKSYRRTEESKESCH